MLKRLICLLLFTLSFAFFPVFAIEKPKGWMMLTGNWADRDKWITPIDTTGRSIPQWVIIRSNMHKESRWSEINFDLKLMDNTSSPQFGLLLNVKSKDDYQLLRICNTTTNPVVQLLRWQYGYYRMWQELKLPEPLVAETSYNLSVQRAPMVDKEDWRQWKIIVTDNTTKRILLKQGIENEQPAFGLGIIGFYSEMTGVSFGNFHIKSKAALAVSGSLRLAPLFSDGMVLQQGSKLRIWGKADLNKKIRIEIARHSYITNSNEAGDWKISIPPLKAQTGLELMVIVGKDSVIVRDVAVGEVWLASGQSNMEMRTWQTDISDLAKGLTDNDLRFFLQPQWSAPNPNFDSGGEWVKADSASVMGWSAIALGFAMELRRKLNVPVGIISSNWGGTAVESWMPRSELATDSVTLPILDRLNQYQLALEKGRLVESIFPWCWDVPGQRHTPGDLYNGMIAPHIPYTLKGMIWYQGESNSSRARQYEHLFPMLISSWRERWQNPNMSFYFVQLAGYDGKQSGSEIEDAWPHIREAQRLTLNRLKNTGMAVTTDIGQVTNIHPPYKREVGIRLSNLALHNDYGFKNIIRSSPLYESAIFESAQSTIYFSEVGAGLKVLTGESLKGFVIAGKDHRFIPATAIIQPDGRSIKVFNLIVINPVAVRYAWENNPADANLGNSANLPASPFRTDDWYLETDKDR